MIKNYIKVAIRNLMRNKSYALINTLGMGIAMSCCMTAYLLIAFNVEFDEYFNDGQVQNVVKVVHHFETLNGKPERDLVIPMDMAPQVVRELSGIEDFTRFCNAGGIVSYGENSFQENIRFVDAGDSDALDHLIPQGGDHTKFCYDGHFKSKYKALNFKVRGGQFVAEKIVHHIEKR